MSLRKKQSKFAHMTVMLFNYILFMGYEFTYGDARAKTGHKENSFHYKGLAIDINLFKDNKYLRKTSDHEFAGKFWESMGGTWGGRWDDGNHYSLGESNGKTSSNI